MKLHKKSNTYKAANVTYNVDTREAYSYGWWRFTEQIGNYLVFNNYNYSNSTCKHQHKVMELLRTLGLEFVTIKAPAGLQKLESAEHYYKTEIKKLESLIIKKGTRKTTNEQRRKTIEDYQHKIALVQKLIKIRGE